MKNLITLLVIIFAINGYTAPLSIPDRQRGEGSIRIARQTTPSPGPPGAVA